MNILSEIGLFVIAMFLGPLWFTFTVLPIFYGLPRSIFWIVKGKLRVSACLIYVGLPFLCTAIFAGSAFILAKCFPQTVTYLYNSAAFFYGQWFGVIYILVGSLSKSGRQKLNENFLDEMKRFQKGTKTNGLDYCDNPSSPSYLADDGH